MLGWALGCAIQDGPERVEALHGGVGYWPADSRTAVRGAIEADLDGVQLDVALTDDRVPVLNPDPWVDPARCTGTDGEPLAPGQLVRTYSWERLQNLRCGGLPDAAYPNAEVVPEAVLGLDELVRTLHDGPNLAVRLSVPAAGPEVGAEDVLADAVLSRWYAEDLPNDLVISSADPVVLGAFDDWAHVNGIDLPLVRSWPAPGASDLGNLLQSDLEAGVSGLDYVALAEEAGADGLELDATIADPGLLRAARRVGVPVWLRVGDDPGDLRRWSRSAAAALVAAYPGDAP